MLQSPEKQPYSLSASLLSLALAATTLVVSPALAQFDTLRVKQAPSPTTIARNLKPGEVIFQGKQGKYIGYTVVQGDIKKLWEVLTDYDNFEKYMPNVVESKILEDRGEQTVFEQVQLFQILFFSRRARVKIVVDETYPKAINFKVVEGEVKSLVGSWKIEPLSSNKYLLTHKVDVEPNIKSNANRDLFFSVYEDTVEKTLKVIQVETAKRSR